ncbi:MAG: hypothetical protein JWN31_983 [Frankiales bacterium]|nr:hypothetical protein [Frankiales bacterium]
MTSRDSGDEGFTLIELLMVMVLMGVLGGITVAGMTQAMKNTRQDQARVYNGAAVETQLQRLIKDVRVADPIRQVTTSALTVDHYTATSCSRVEWRINGTTLQQRIQTWSSTSPCLVYPATVTATTDTGYLTRLTNITSATPFNYLDNGGAVLTTPTSATTKQVTVTLTQSQPENRGPITLSATTYLRNAL